MKTKNSYTVKMPDYAMSYIFNSDSSGLNDEDIKNIDNWTEKELKKNQCDFSQFIVTIPDMEESYFSSLPVFGLPCNVYDCKIIIFEKES